MIEHFSLVLTVETLWADIGRLRRFSKGGWVNLSANFKWKGTSSTNLCWYQKTRLITLSYGIKILVVCSFVLLQSTRETDRRTDGQADRQNYDSQDRASIAASRGKNPLSVNNSCFRQLLVKNCWLYDSVIFVSLNYNRSGLVKNSFDAGYWISYTLSCI